MTDWTPIIVAAIPSAVAALAAGLTFWQGARNAASAAATKKNAEEIKAQVVEVHATFNSRMDRLIELTKQVAFAEGKAAQKTISDKAEAHFAAGQREEKGKS